MTTAQNHAEPQPKPQSQHPSRDGVSLDRNLYKFQTEVRVRLSETDAVGIVFFGSFSSYMDVGRMDYLQHLGLSQYGGPVKDLFPGAVVQAALSFRAPARYNDVLLIHVRIARMGRSSYTFHMMIEQKRDRQLVATGVLTLVWLDEGFTPSEVPAEVVGRVAAFEGAALGTMARGEREP
jgi:acyl-CoA thioester hydrolase